MQPLFDFLDITKVANFQGKGTDVSGVCHVIYIFLGVYFR